MAKSATSPLARIAVLAYPSCSCWITAGLLEIFGIANLMLAQFAEGKRTRLLDFHVISARSARNVKASHGVTFQTQQPLARYDAVIIPPLWCESLAEFDQRIASMKAELAFMRELPKRSRIIASSCSGAALLATAGLLDGQRATTCWWLVNWFAKRFPNVQLQADQILIAEGQRWTSAAGSAYMHLGIELVRELAGDKVANVTSRLMLVEPRRGTQSPFLVDAPPAEHHDAEVKRAIEYLDSHATSSITMPALSRKLAVSERTLARKFQSQVGMSPLAYLQSRRIAHAKQLLESSSLALDRIVERCGYADVASFRKLFTRLVGMTPREYRTRFATNYRAAVS
jgi:transcriptional regulator GlxA family with amidase domain